MPAGESPLFRGSLDLTPDVLNEMKKAGANANGNYKLQVALWTNDRREKDTAPHYKGLVTVPGVNGSPKGYASVWDNRKEGSGSSSGSSDDLF